MYRFENDGDPGQAARFSLLGAIIQTTPNYPRLLTIVNKNKRWQLESTGNSEIEGWADAIKQHTII